MRTVVKLLLMFAVAQVLGVVVAYAFISGSGAALAYEQYSLEDMFFLILGFAFAILFVVAIVRLYKGMLLYRLMEFVVVAAATFIVFYGIGWYVGYGETVSVVLALALAFIKFFEPRARNAAAVLSSIGVAVMFAMFLSFVDALIFLIIMSLYDYFAVFITKHMVTLASEFGRRNMSFSVTAQEKIKERVRVKIARGRRKGQIKEIVREKIERLELGTGDIALPLSFNLVVFRLMAVQNPGAAASAFIVLSTFSVLALAFVLVFVRKQRLFLPALPPILLGTVAGYMLAYISGIIV